MPSSKTIRAKRKIFCQHWTESQFYRNLIVSNISWNLYVKKLHCYLRNNVLMMTPCLNKYEVRFCRSKNVHGVFVHRHSESTEYNAVFQTYVSVRSNASTQDFVTLPMHDCRVYIVVRCLSWSLSSSKLCPELLYENQSCLSTLIYEYRVPPHNYILIKCILAAPVLQLKLRITNFTFYLYWMTKLSDTSLVTSGALCQIGSIFSGRLH